MEAQVLQLLGGLTAPAQPAIQAAEAGLNALAQQGGYGTALLRIVLAREQVPPHLRQLAAVLLKQFVRTHWMSGERGFQPPEVSDQDKAAIRDGLPGGLRDPDAKVRTACGAAVAAVAAWDWPAAWPGLLDLIVASIKERSDPHLVAGCLRCLSILAADLDSEQAPALLQALSPELAALVGSADTPPPVAANCLRVMAELTAGLGSLSGAFQRQARDVLLPLMQAWLPLIAGVLAAPPSPASLAPTAGALRLAHQLVLYFSKPLDEGMPALLGATWQLMLALQPLHQAQLVEGAGGAEEDAAAAADGDDEPVQLQHVLAQMFELLLSIVGVHRFKAQVQAALPQMAYYAVAFLQMGQEQAEEWATDAAQFVADEDEDVVSCRGSCEMLLSDLADEFAPAALAAILDAAARRCSEADAAAAAGQASWWQLREAAHMAVATCTDQLEQAVLAGEAPAAQLQALLEQLLARDLQPLLQPQQQQAAAAVDAGRQFVMARALFLGSKLQEAATRQQQEGLLQAAAAAVTLPSAIAPLRLLGYRALAACVQGARAPQLAALLPVLLPALVQQLLAADEESLHLVLELLEAVIRAAAGAAMMAGPEGAAYVVTPEQAMSVAQPVLQVWLRHTSDPLIAPDAQEVIAALARHPGCLPALAAAAVPTLAGILERGAAGGKRTHRSPSEARAAAAAAAAASGGGSAAAAAAAAEVPEDAPMLVEASLDLLGALVEPGQPAVAAELCRGVLGPVLRLVASSDDPSELSSAVSLLMQLMRACSPEQLLASNGANGSSSSSSDATLTQLLAAARHLLHPQQSDAATRLAGPFMAQLSKTFPAQLAAPPPPALLSMHAAASAQQPAPGGFAAGSCVALLLHDTAAKMASGSCSPASVAALLQFIVRLVLLDVHTVVELLAGMQLRKPDGSSTSGLAVVVPLWLEHATDLPGGLPTRHCAAALVQLLQLRHHPALAGLTVPGRPLEAPAAQAGGGRVTRAKARQQGGLQFSQVPAPAKVLMVLGTLLTADQESAGGHDTAWARSLAAQWADEEDDEDEDDSVNGPADSPGRAAGPGGGTAAAALHAAGMGALEAEALSNVMERSAAPTPAPDDPLDASDPLARITTRALLQQGLGALAAADPAFLTAAGQALGPGPELTALQELLASAATPGQQPQQQQ